jgi:hypothetical protein
MTMPNFGAGGVLFASDLQQLSDQIESLTAPGWTSYTPVITTSGTAFSLGNGTVTGRYRRSASSDLVIATGVLTFGSTTSVGTGSIFASLPLTASAAAVTQQSVGRARILDSGVTNFGGVSTVMQSTTTLAFMGHNGQVTNTWMTWNTNDQLAWEVEYEPA